MCIRDSHSVAGAVAPADSWPALNSRSGGRPKYIARSAAADVTITYLTDSGQSVIRSKSVPANSRLTINIEAEGSTVLANAAVATRVLSTIPVVVERAQYWPNAPSQWYEAHNAFGVTAAGTRWGLSEGQTGRFEAANTYLLLANNTNSSATVTVDFIREVDVPVTKTFTVPANTRFNVAVGPNTQVPELSGERFGAVVTSTAPIVVERAVYWNANGEFWSAGTNATATALLP